MKNTEIIEEPIHVDSDDTWKQVHEPLVVDGTKVPTPHVKGMLKLVESVKEAFMGVEERHGYCTDQLRLAQNFEDGQYVQAVVDAVRQSSKLKTWVKVQIIDEEPDPNMSRADAVKKTTLAHFV